MKIKDLNNTIINSMIMTGTVIDCKEGYMEVSQQSLSEPTLTISVPSTVTVGTPTTITVTASVVGDITVYINQEYYQTSVGESTMSFTYTPEDTFTIEAYFSSTQGISANASQKVVLINFTPAVQSFNPLGDNYNDVFQEWLYNNGYSANAEYTTMEEALNLEEIPNNAFENNTSLTHMDELRYFNNLKNIRDEAFMRCTNLTSITMPENPNYSTEIYARAFAYTGLIEFDSGIGGVFAIYPYYGHGGRQFLECHNLKRVFLRNDICISYSQFAYCDNLEEITILQPQKIFIYGRAFANCNKLVNVNIYGKFYIIDGDAFINCTMLDNISLDISSNQSMIYSYTYTYCTTLSSTVIPPNVDLIDDGAYYGCTNLSIIYCYAVTPPSLGTYNSDPPFDGVPRSANVYVPKGSGNAYRNADVWKEFNIVEITDEVPDSWAVQQTKPDGEKYNPQLQIWSHSNGYSADTNYTTKTEAQAVTIIEANAFNNNTNLTSINELQYFTNISIINDHAFRGTTNLTTGILPPSVTDIYVGAFQNSGIQALNPRMPYNNIDYSKGASNITASNVSRSAFAGSNLTSVTFGSNTTTVGTSAFEGCLSLRNVYGEDSGWISVQNNTFKNCSMLKNIYLPSTITMLLNNVVDGCTSLEAIWCYATTPPSVTASTFYNMAADVTLYVPYESLSAYKNSNWAKYFSTILPISTPVTYACQSIDANGQNYNPALQEYLYSKRIASNSGYTTETEASNLYEIADRGLAGKTNLTSLINILSNFPNLNKIGNEAFEGCKNLKYANIPSTVIHFGDNVFARCSSLDGCYLDQSQITSIGLSTFIDCTLLTTVTLPSTVTYIENGAFHNCGSLIGLYCYATTPPEVYSGAFDNKSNINLYVPSESVSAYQNSTYWQGFKSYNAIQ